VSRLALCELLIVAALGCGRHAGYVCEVSSQCVLGGQSGVCEPDGHCAFPDVSCPSGYRYESEAGDGLAGTCVGATDAGQSCGTLGGACCTSGATCGDNLFCDSGSCKQCITDVSHGQVHSCFLKYDGTVWCSGYNSRGELGNGGMSTVPTATPVQVIDTTNAAIHDATALGLGSHTSCAIRANGTPWCWGGNNLCPDGGQLGDGTKNSRGFAAPVLREDGTGFTGVEQLGGEYCQMVARSASGALWAWGDKNNGDLGDGGLLSHSKAISVTDSSGAPITDAVDLSSDGPHSCYRNAADEIWCWGQNSNGQIGDGTRNNAVHPVHVFDGIALAGGRFHTCALKSDNTMWCWGQGNQGRLGNGEGDRNSGTSIDQLRAGPVVTAIGGTNFGDVSAISAGSSTCAILANKDLYCWGVDVYGQIGTGTGTYVPMPVLKADGTPLHDVVRVVARYNRTCAFTGDGALYCWGRNSEGQLGIGTFWNVGLATSIKASCP
jgi:alpha-tubulin suppressor-like RCC1 family protein